VDELTQALHHIKTKIEHQIEDLAGCPPVAQAERSEESLLEQIKYKKLLKSQLSDVDKAIELSLDAIRLRNVIGRGE
jgi:hypothetical protein